MNRDWPLVIFALALATLVAASGLIMWWAHKDDAALQAECEARGGQLIEARSPMHVCVAVPKKIP